MTDLCAEDKAGRGSLLTVAENICGRSLRWYHSVGILFHFYYESNQTGKFDACEINFESGKGIVNDLIRKIAR